jgi:hypothetical protein
MENKFGYYESDPFKEGDIILVEIMKPLPRPSVKR